MNYFTQAKYLSRLSFTFNEKNPVSFKYSIMSHFRSSSSSLLLFVIIITAIGCNKKKEMPQVLTSEILQIDFDTLLGGGTIISEGDSPVRERGVCWSIGQNPTIEGTRTSDGSGSGDFKSKIMGFKTNATYFFRAYATNDEGTAYGEQVSYEVKAMYPDLKIQPAAVKSTSVTLDVEVNIDNSIIIWSSGVCYSTDPVPTLNSPAALNETQTTVSYTVTINNLLPATTYYFRPFLIFRLYSTGNYYYVYGDIVRLTTL